MKYLAWRSLSIVTAGMFRSMGEYTPEPGWLKIRLSLGDGNRRQVAVFAAVSAVILDNWQIAAT